MQTKITVLFTLLASIGPAKAATDPTILSDKTYACVSTGAAAGLSWNGSNWEAKRFQDFGKFILNVMTIEESDKQQFIHFTFKGDAKELHCGTRKQFDLTGSQSCLRNGVSVVFSEESQRGGLSYLLGSVSKERNRDSLAVLPFTCSKF